MFYKETDFQDSPIGKIPKEWKVRTIESLFVVETGTTPSTKEEAYWEGGAVNWITPTDLSKLNGKLRVRSSERKITEKALKETNLTLMPKGSLILSTRAPVGYVAVLEEDATFNQGCKGLILKNPKEILPEFYYYYLLSKKQMLQNLSGGSTFKELSKDRLEKFAVSHLPVEEQKGIVGVLGVVDSVISKVDEVIWKTKRLKKGLLQRLLTRGIGHKEFKDTETGKIPKEWKTVSIGEVIKSIRSGVSREFTADDTGYAVIRSTNIYDNKLDTSEVRYWHLEDPQGTDLTGYVLDNGDILVNFINSIDQIGKSCIFVKQARDFIYTTNIFRIKLNEKFLIHEYFHFFAQTDIYRKQIRRITKAAVHQASFTQDDFKRITILIPSIREQENIVSILANVDRKLELETIEKEQLTRIKQGLMDLLLTGKVRVKVD
jgi:type I restriction enzyme S subunit